MGRREPFSNHMYKIHFSAGRADLQISASRDELQISTSRAKVSSVEICSI